MALLISHITQEHIKNLLNIWMQIRPVLSKRITGECYLHPDLERISNCFWFTSGEYQLWQAVDRGGGQRRNTILQLQALSRTTQVSGYCSGILQRSKVRTRFVCLAGVLRTRHRGLREKVLSKT